MNKRELAKLKKWTDTLTDEQLKKEYYDAVFDTLGSQAEEMQAAKKAYLAAQEEVQQEAQNDEKTILN